MQTPMSFALDDVSGAFSDDPTNYGANSALIDGASSAQTFSDYGGPFDVNEATSTMDGGSHLPSTGIGVFSLFARVVHCTA